MSGFSVTRLSKARGSHPRLSREYPIADYDGAASANTRRDSQRREQGETVPPYRHAGETVLMKPSPRMTRPRVWRESRPRVWWEGSARGVRYRCSRIASRLLVAENVSLRGYVNAGPNVAWSPATDLKKIVEAFNEHAGCVWGRTERGGVSTLSQPGGRQGVYI
jgi:hypothetical protein